ncbi:lipopolysaccharide biosynthesis protein [Halopseudomonas yangmingensis]|uniref:Membrane protein involved in the export of O-antigen and teichoic acid n=1 Tax=Halopseudomonas yangmingensis TaxID=1720063 RepID=A0A1I4T1Y0_9GAMM|nr:hypothetical protein [Halopseudomonas yangmingensis]SFM70661.1 Membrane protein involved in the export of O-antigen and teichoic acid [Halopseudomonas yangmingensis]
MTRLANLALRGMTLVSKFLLIFMLAKLLDPEEVGLYGLVAATVGYALYLLGFDFYTYTTRELLKREKTEWGGLLKSQCAFSMVTYLVFMPLLLILFAFDVLPSYLLGWFFALLVVEHISQELNRLLIAISRPLLASCVLFLRTGLWALLVVGVMFWQPASRSLENVLMSWTLGAAIAVVLGAGSLLRMGLGGWRRQIDWRWVWSGIKIAIPFLLATLAVRGIYTLDRYWFESFAGMEVLAAYVLFIGMSNALMSFLDAGVFAFMYPALISHWQQCSANDFKRQLKQLLLHTAVFCLLFITVAALVLPLLLDWIGRPVYQEHSYLFGWLMAATVLMALSMIPHYALYAQGKDKHIIFSHLGALLVFILSVLVLAPFNTLLAVPAAICCSFFVMLVWKVLAYYLLTPVEYQMLRSAA